LLILTTAGCAKLMKDLWVCPIDATKPASSADLNGVYSQLNGQTDQANTYALQEHSTDEMMGPTRGTDWGDFGTWRKLHTHSWTASHNQISDTWDQLNIGVFRASQVIAQGNDDSDQSTGKLFTGLLYVPDS
jgi:hypothetical protein